MDLLNQFQNDEHRREAVLEFLLKQMDTMVLEKVYLGEDVKGIADAREAIKRAFIELQELYGKDKIIKNINHAR